MIEILGMEPDNRKELLDAIAYLVKRRDDAYSTDKKHYDVAICSLREKAGEA